ncbi:hypothetical protein DFH06DRAFT_1127394 [Mycena polygramma]|nr:hypothetical protein DFH06DRAFT_1127394 [Mycena polygramma]
MTVETNVNGNRNTGINDQSTPSGRHLRIPSFKKRALASGARSKLPLATGVQNYMLIDDTLQQMESAETSVRHESTALITRGTGDSEDPGSVTGMFSPGFEAFVIDSMHTFLSRHLRRKFEHRDTNPKSGHQIWSILTWRQQEDYLFQESLDYGDTRNQPEREIFDRAEHGYLLVLD